MRKLLITLPLVLAAAVPAHAAERVVIRGAGFGHGIGLSQYGAFGYAEHGTDYKTILHHYYSDTDLAELSPSPDVRVLLRTGSRSATFSGATHAGSRTLQPDRSYSLTKTGAGTLALKSAAGRKLASFTGVLRITGPAADAPIALRGPGGYNVHDGQWRGALEISVGASGVDVVNAIDLEDYVRGVISGESPSSWPAEALKAQAVAARTYAVTTDAGSRTDGFTQYADTRSQVYRGVAADTAATDAAVAATTHQVVTYGGKPVTTYFFSTSGGHTENVENSFVGALPRPWLRGVDDPFDGASPKHRWGPYNLTVGQTSRKLGGLLKGSFKAIKVLRRGTSPRIVRAEVIGSKGTTAVTGPELRKRFGLFDSWIYFRIIGAKAAPKKKADTPPATTDPTTTGGDPASGGTSPRSRWASAASAGRALTGFVRPGRRGAWIRVQSRAADGTWSTATWTTLGRGGRYRVGVPPGVYRVRYANDTGPTVRVS